METKTYNTNGVNRKVEGKKFGDEFRVYRIYGDITDRPSLGELAQQIAEHTGCTTIRMPA
ncbi:MAG: hypothetical protein K2Q20_11425 [Phycisphaerales bacterium]|nr:hypothetical protein [Phycisphaerales bacterium]